MNKGLLNACAALTLFVLPLGAHAEEECTLSTLMPVEKEKLNKMLSDVAMLGAQATKECRQKVAASAEMPFIEIWIDKDGRTLRRGSSHDAKLTLVVVVDGVVTLERAFDAEAAYDIGEAPGVLRSYYIKSFIGDSYRVISNVLYVK